LGVDQEALMAVVRVKNWQEGDTYICDKYNDWADSQREFYTPFLHESGGWRIRYHSITIDHDGNRSDPNEEIYEFELPCADRYALAGETPRGQFSTHNDAVRHIRMQTFGFKNGERTPTPRERAMERDDEEEIQRLVAKDE
jgi:hypothetical protein